MRTMTDYPCRYCVAPKRYPGCHDHCTEYKDVKEKEQRNKNADAGSKDAYRYTMECIVKNNDNNVKKRRSGRLTYSKKG